MECFCLLWIPDRLSEAQKGEWVSHAQEVIRVRDNNVRIGFESSLTGDEPWMSSNQSATKMRALECEFVDRKLRPTHYERETMITVFVGVDRIARLNILPQDWKLISESLKNMLFANSQSRISHRERTEHVTLYALFR
jgi:hypothetical protein